MSIAEAVQRVQAWYPQIYLACHIDHKRAGSTRSGISPRDSSLLAHLDTHRPQTPAALARHMRIGAPSMSATLKRLRQRGFVRVDRHPGDARRLEVRLTSSGAEAMAEASVLDASRLRVMLKQLPPTDRRRAIDGLGLLARAARALAEKQHA